MSRLRIPEISRAEERRRKRVELEQERFRCCRVIIRGNCGSIDDRLYRESEEEEELSTYTPRWMAVRGKLSR